MAISQRVRASRTSVGEQPCAGLVCVVMAKDPTPGAVKSRIVGERFDPHDASAIADAMLCCVVDRLRGRGGEVVLAVSPDDAAAGLADRLGGRFADVLGQGSGDLGERMNRVWRRVADERPVAFFGVDSPDVPDDSLRSIRVALEDHDAAIGPTDDGGYWTLAARRPIPALLQNIDWGSANVYDATLRRATGRDVAIASLPAWYDVDEPADVDELLQRITRPGRPSDPALDHLARRLGSIVSEARGKRQTS